MSEQAVDMNLVLRALLFANPRGLSVSDQIEVLDSSGWSNAQIGEAVGLTANAVKKRKQNKKVRD
jgi:DNA-binding NarL/FixJ family response regulator